ncbi:MAG: GNAT family N-acetyltransferase [Chloroflexota bacterium]|nr:GNAT family N-acetyltransferase [Chloroflexota bacterium]
MTIEYRRLRSDDELRAHSRIAEYAFNGSPHDDDAIARRERWYERDWCLGAFDGQEMVAGLTVIPFEMYLNGASIPLGGVASVSSLPERRRGGVAGGLLRYSLASMRDAGQPLSALYTPHYSLYRRYGWEIASRIVSYAFPPKVSAPRLGAPKGTYRRVDAGGWREVEALYTEHMARRNGGLVRPERWWRTQVLATWRGDPRDAVIWSNARGEPRGYAVYRSSMQHAAASPVPDTTLRVSDWVALDAEAYAALLAYLLGHDLATRIVMLASTDEPFAAAFQEPAHFAEPAGAWNGLMLRLVDVQRALEARPALPQASGKGITLALTDDAAPWNAGTWRIEAGEGRISAERTDAEPELEMDARALAPIYNGFTRPADAVRVGQVRARSDAAIAAATDIFATSYAPFTPDDF